MLAILEAAATDPGGLFGYGQMLIQLGALGLLAWILRILFTRVPNMVDTMSTAHTAAVKSIADAHEKACADLGEKQTAAVTAFTNEARETRSMFRQEQEAARATARVDQEALRTMALTMTSQERASCEARSQRLEEAMRLQGSAIEKLAAAVDKLEDRPT